MRRLVILSLALIVQAALAQSIPADAAGKVFQTAERVNGRDGGRLWGMPVCGPMFVVDPDTHEVVANQADAQEFLKKDGSVWRGKLPAAMTPANSATDWGGVRWTMLMWPVTTDTRDRERLVGHECFHRIQKELRLVPRDRVASHLDDKEERIWLQLEWRALERALVTAGEQRRAAIADALAFRNYRRLLIKGAAATENGLEMNEGLAEYTGFRLASANEADRRAAAIYALHSGPAKQSFGRSFAYVSGPAYGLLLDASGIEWKNQLTPETDWGALLANAYRLSKVEASGATAPVLAKGYEGATLIAAESQRAVEIEAKRAEVRKIFVDGPVLVLPIDEEFGYGFNPNDTLSLDENSTVYGWARITARWGVLETSNGALMTRREGKIVRIVVPAARNAESGANEDWKLTLNPGWKIAGAERAGDQTLQKQ
jgi:hypothetical protein